MRKYSITGMSCAACSARVEKTVSALSGVDSCSVNLLTNSMTVEGNATDEEITRAVTGAGYGIKSASTKKTEANDSDDEIKTLKYRLCYSLVFLAVLMYISMGHNMWGLPLPKALAMNPMAQGLIQLLLTIIVMVINKKFFVSGFKSFIKCAPNMDTLVALGSGAAFIYSVYVLFVMTANVGHSSHYLHDLYFESSAMILTLITVGKLLETRSKGKTAEAIKGLMDLAPKTAVVLRDGRETIVSVNELALGEIFLVRPGERIATDGVIIDGESTVDESFLTGESIPVDKAKGDKVVGSTINKLGFLKCQVTKTAEDNTLAEIIKMVSDTAATKAPIARAADKVSGVFVPVVIGIALVSAIVWLSLGKDLGFALARGISVLVISCPCALGLATPVAIMVGSGLGAKNGILFKNATSLETLGKVKTAFLDKTGTITEGKPLVTDIITFNGYTKTELLKIAASVEFKSEHPLAKAIVEEATNEKTELLDAKEFMVHSGSGVSAHLDGKKYIGGNMTFVGSLADIDEEMLKNAESLAEQGKTPMFFAEDKTIIGIIAVADTIKPDSRDAIDELKALGIKVVMLTGDNQKTAKVIAAKAGVDTVYAEVLPKEKADKVKELMSDGKIVMVGDGINDAVSLKTADVGVAIGRGADIAIDAADVVLIRSSLSDVCKAIRLSRGVMRNIRQNLFWAFLYNVLGIPLAAGAFISVLGWEMNPMFGAAAMSLSSFSVVSNALRLNFLNINGKKITSEKEKKSMEKTLKIEGMMCPHCEANVKNTIEGLDGAASALVSHKDGTVMVKMTKEIPDEVLKKAIEDKGYKVTEIK